MGSEHLSELEQLFVPRGVVRGGLLFLRAPEALEFIEAARLRSLPVLGIDGFELTETTTKPCLEHILDLSPERVARDTWQEAKQFVEERGASTHSPWPWSIWPPAPRPWLPPGARKSA